MSKPDKRALTLRLDPFFLHPRLVREALPATMRQRVDIRIAEGVRRGGFPEGFIHEVELGRSLALAFPGLDPPELARKHLDSSLKADQVVGIQQAFYFKRRESEGHEYIDFHGKLNTDASITVKGTLNSDHCIGTSGREHLSGHKNVYLLGTVSEIKQDTVLLRPMFAGRRFYAPDDDHGVELPERRGVFPSSIDQFSRLGEAGRVRLSDLELLRDIPEKRVKESFAELIGETFVPKDWGGETSDLYTSQLSISGTPYSAAFLLKGPSFFKPMTIAALGKNGDQIDRLFREPADLYVLQHCHQVRAEVINMMEVYAWDARSPKRYMIIDGPTTFRILRAYGHL